jgi:hypothetical protein
MQNKFKEFMDNPLIMYEGEIVAGDSECNNITVKITHSVFANGEIRMGRKIKVVFGGDNQ